MANYQICSRCLMDTTVPEIEFDDNGICIICKNFIERIQKEVHNDSKGHLRLVGLIEKIKNEGKGKDYDCIIGVSGGVDSTYVAYLVKKIYGLRPLAVHLDNGWDSELAVANIEQVLKRLNIDLYTYVLDWEEFKDLQISFLKSSISNAEIPTDHAIWALLIRTAAKYGIRYIITGSNIVTEALMPNSWLYNSKDAKIIKSIQNQYGRAKLRKYPMLSTVDFVYFFIIRRIRWIPILNYITYEKEKAKNILIQELGWRDYGGKHYESIFTRFFHAYYLPIKFGIDLRRSYLSALVVSGQKARNEALEELLQPPASLNQIEEDIEFVIKKLGLSMDEFNKIMKDSPQSYTKFPNSQKLWERFDNFVRVARQRAIKV